MASLSFVNQILAQRKAKRDAENARVAEALRLQLEAEGKWEAYQAGLYTPSAYEYSIATAGGVRDNMNYTVVNPQNNISNSEVGDPSNINLSYQDTQVQTKMSKIPLIAGVGVLAYLFLKE